MVSPEVPPATTNQAEPTSGRRISFSGDPLDDADFISINPNDKNKDKNEKTKTSEFEFLSTTLAAPTTMLTADELFFEGKLLPFGQKQCANKLKKINLKCEEVQDIAKTNIEVKSEDNNSNNNNNNNRMGWFIDEDPSPRPPKCTVLWKELLRLKKHRASSLSTSYSTSSSSSSSSVEEDGNKKEKQVKKGKIGLERTRSAGLKIRPMVNLPVCTQGVRSISVPPPYYGRKGMLDR